MGAMIHVLLESLIADFLNMNNELYCKILKTIFLYEKENV